MKRNKNRDRLACGFLSLVLAAGMTQGCASPHVNDASNQNTQETEEAQTPSYSYEDAEQTGGGSAPAETNTASGAGKRKTPEEEKTLTGTSKEENEQKKENTEASSSEEKKKTEAKENKENKENKDSKPAAETIKANSPAPSEDDKDDEDVKEPQGQADPDRPEPQTEPQGNADRQEPAAPDGGDEADEDTEDRDSYDADSPAAYEYPEDENAGGEITDDLPEYDEEGTSSEDTIEAVYEEDDTSGQGETAPEEASMGEMQTMPEDTPEEPVYDILAYIGSIESLENLVGLLEMSEAEPRILTDCEDVRAYEKDSLHIEFSAAESRIHIANEGDILPNIVNVTAGSSLLGEDYNSLGVMLEAGGWIPEAEETDPAEPVLTAAYRQNVNGMELLFTIRFGEDNKISSWTIDTLQQ